MDWNQILKKITLIKKKNYIPDFYNITNNKIVPMLAGEFVDWSVKS